MKTPIGSHATTITTTPDGTWICRLHTIDIVRRTPDGTIHLNTGGWNTPTARRRMNQCLEFWGSLYRVSQRNVAFTIWHPDGGSHEPDDGRTFTIRPGAREAQSSLAPFI